MLSEMSDRVNELNTSASARFENARDLCVNQTYATLPLSLNEPRAEGMKSKMRSGLLLYAHLLRVSVSKLYFTIAVVYFTKL